MESTTETDSSEPCVDFTEIYPDPTNSAISMTIFGIIYTHIFILGLLGNISMMFLTLRHRHLQTVQNIFILNLAMSDVIICLLSVPITPITNALKQWFFGEYICHLLPFIQAVSVFVSTFSLSAIALDRYNLVIRPHANIIKPKSAIKIATILWIIAAFVSAPYCYFMKIENYPGYCGQFCTERWPNPLVRRGYALVLLCCQFLIPFAIMSFCYSVIFSRLRERANSKIRKLDERSQLLESSRGPEAKTNEHCSVTKVPSKDQQKAQLLAKQRRTTTILASMVLIFGLSWLPHNVITLIIEYDENILHIDALNYTYIVSTIAHSIAMTNNVANPVLYAWLNPSFKEILIKLFWYIMPSKRHQTTNSTTTTTTQSTRLIPNRESVIRLNSDFNNDEKLV
uniref:G-protein coupled receptors family 1 profile domain-containing protein n=1 Tax=Panagrolaimus sp. PS1159 TaxID=55785 RepID=A0AC35F0W4_9BILA